eukprot:COSAG01_NODE_686_length_14245_cov_95.096140_7_plen_69_part_00
MSLICVFGWTEHSARDRVLSTSAVIKCVTCIYLFVSTTCIHIACFYPPASSLTEPAVCLIREPRTSLL